MEYGYIINLFKKKNQFTFDTVNDGDDNDDNEGELYNYLVSRCTVTGRQFYMYCEKLTLSVCLSVSVSAVSYTHLTLPTMAVV